MFKLIKIIFFILIIFIFIGVSKGLHFKFPFDTGKIATFLKGRGESTFYFLNDPPKYPKEKFAFINPPKYEYDEGKIDCPILKMERNEPPEKNLSGYPSGPKYTNPGHEHIPNAPPIFNIGEQDKGDSIMLPKRNVSINSESKSDPSPPQNGQKITIQSSKISSDSKIPISANQALAILEIICEGHRKDIKVLCERFQEKKEKIHVQ